MNGASGGVVSRALSVLPLWVALALYGWSGGAWTVAGIAAAIAAASIATSKRAPLAPGAQRFVLVIAIAIGVVAGVTRTPAPGWGPGTLTELGSAVALPMLLALTARAWLAQPERGASLSFALGVVAVGACGGTRLGAGYTAFAIAFVAASLATMHDQDASRTRWSELPRRGAIAGGAIVVVAFGLAFAGTSALPALYDYAQARFDFAYEYVGFKGELRLGGLDDLKKSEEIVLRISGAPTDYLRGAVYDRFDAATSSWGLARANVRVLALPTSHAKGAAGVEVRRVGGWGERYFLPLRAGAIGSPAAEAIVDTMGVMRPQANRRYDRYWFDADAPDRLDATPPSTFDTRVPDRLRPALEAIVAEWTTPSDAPAAVLTKIAQHLEGSTYSLSFKRTSKDPIVEFLTTNKQGNCEYFASAMTLLARAANVPARVATGYRVAERNPISGQYLVRQKNAHAWVEAWVDGAWRTYDPTPASQVDENLAHDTSTARALLDLVASAWASVLEVWSSLGPFELAGIALGLGALFVVVRFARRGRTARAEVEGGVERPLPCLERLLRALAARGVTRAPSEPLERLARRLHDVGMREPAELLVQYAALRYGGIGDERAIARAMERCAATLP
jgi:transglutaminase-like putative cysteine protease